MSAKETICTCDDAFSPALYNPMPLIGDEAPAFVAETTMGPVTFPDDYRGKWVILFSHPADFTPVCTSEIALFSTYADEFKKLDTELLGVSVDSVSSHLAWLKEIEDNIGFKGYKDFKITFPIIADLSMEVAKKYGMIQPHSSSTKTIRSVFLIDPDGKIRASIMYPMSNGRNLDEIKRILIAMQTTDEKHVSTPANWQPGDEVVVAAPATMDELKRRAGEKGHNCETWFFCLKNIAH